MVKEATKAREKYYTTPSTKNGSRRQEADDEAKNAINSASQIIWSTWAKDFKVLITQDELIGMIEDELVDLDHSQCEKLWIGTIAKELTTRRA